MSQNYKIILEGVDGSGKTTLAHSIMNKFPDLNFKLVHLTKETPNNRNYFESLLLSKDNIIFDRFHIGQFIYQTEEQRKLNGWMSNSDLIELENLINRMKAIVKIIYVDTPTDTCFNNCKRDSEDHNYTKAYIDTLKNKYRSFIKNSKNDILIYNNNFKSPDYELVKSRDFYDSLPYIIGVDFDGVLATDCFPDIKNSKPNVELIKDLIKEQRKGTKVILWTCRTDETLNDAIKFCIENGFVPDAVNDNIQELKQVGLNPRKIYCNEYIDDKASYLNFV